MHNVWIYAEITKGNVFLLNALEKMNHKIRVYENAVKTGVLNWESDTCGCSSEKG